MKKLRNFLETMLFIMTLVNAGISLVRNLIAFREQCDERKEVKNMYVEYCKRTMERGDEKCLSFDDWRSYYGY